jgi:threonyl-tRNA synthetase
MNASPLDHRDLNRDLNVFASDPLAGSGLPLWMPAGAAIRNELQHLAKDLAHADGCIDVYSPVLGKRVLFEKSGHLAKFAADMFPPMKLGEDEVMLRPANCPHHALIYSANQHSYRELPIRYNELAPMFRAERSGAVSGLSRVRQINLDDSHVFCRPDQAGAEAARGLRSALNAQRILGLPVDYVRLSMRDDSDEWLGSPQQWHDAQEALREAGREVLAEFDVPLVEAPGEAAFYGPKFDLQVRDGRGHEESIATVQLDFNQPERFDLAYEGADGKPHRVVMIHRGAVGSMERVVASLLERYQGRLPFWLSPVQVVVLPVSPAQDEPARQFLDQCRAAGLRAEIDHDGSLGSRIRLARGRRDHLIAVIGEVEAAEGLVQVNDVGQKMRFSVAPDRLVAAMQSAHQQRDRYIDADGFNH